MGNIKYNLVAISMIVILASDLKSYNKDNGNIVPTKIDNINYLVDNIKCNIKNNKGLLFIPSDMNDEERPQKNFDILVDSLKLSGVNFQNTYLLTLDNKEKLEEYISDSSLIFLSGGVTYTQHLLFEELNLSELLKKYDGLIIGQSAGAINLADNVYNSPESLEEKNIYFKGLGLTDINIEPHFELDIDTKDQLELYQRNHILKESNNRIIYGIPDGSYILINDKNTYIYGESYLIKDGKIALINSNSTVFKIG